MAGKFQLVMDCLEDLQKLGFDDMGGTMSTLAFFRNYELGQDKKEQAPKDPLSRVDRRERMRVANSEMKPQLSLDHRRKKHRETPVLTLEEHKRLSQGLKSHISGSPMCLSVSESLIAIGGDNGVVQTFETSGKRGKVLKHPKYTEIGPVTAMAFCQDGSLLLVGHAVGCLVLWDLDQSVPLCLHDTTARSPLLQVRVFRSSHIHGLYSTVTGAVTSFQVVRSMFFDMEMQTQSLEIEENGPCVAIEPLPEGPKDNSLNAAFIVAFGMATTVLLYSFKPKRCPFARIEVAKAPYLSWSWHQSEAILCIGHLTSVALYRLKASFKSGVTSVGFCTLASEVRGLHITPCGKVVVIDNFRDFHVFAPQLFAKDPHDPTDKKALLQVVKYAHDLHYSRLLAGEPDKDCEYYQNSTVLRNSSLYILGDKRLYRGQILPWAETGKRLMEKASWLDALAFAMDLYSSRTESVLDLSAFESFAKDLILSYMNVTVLKWENKLPIVVEFCVFIEATGYLLGELSQIFLEQGDNQGYLNALLHALEPFIFSDNITTVPTFVLGKIMAFYINENQSEKIEMMIIHLDAKSLDMQYIRGYCEQYALITAQIYLSTHAAEPDFAYPLTFVCKAIEDSEDTVRRRDYGLKLMWYLRLTLTGELFPNGHLASEQHAKVAVQLVGWMLGKSNLKTMLALDVPGTLQLLWTLFDNRKLSLIIKSSRETSHSVILSYLHQISTPELETPISIFIGKATKSVSTALEEGPSLRVVRHLLTCQITEKDCKCLVEAQIFESMDRLESEIESCIIAVLETSLSIKDTSITELIKMGAQAR